MLNFNIPYEPNIKVAQTITKGFGILATKKIIFAALARNVEQHIDNFINQYYAMADLCYDANLVLYENDSEDGTKNRLKQWAKADQKVSLISEDLGIPPLGGGADEARCRNMCRCRNAYLKRVLQYTNYFDYLCVVDVDLAYISLEGIAHSFGLDLAWDIESILSTTIYGA
jgi:hypothetical protein